MAAIPLKMNSHAARVLVVDDDDSYCTIIRELLVRNGYDVRVAYSVEEALSLLQEEPPDLILTDLMMPEVDGITFIRQRRATPPHSGIPMIVVSALVLARERAAAAPSGRRPPLWPSPFRSNNCKRPFRRSLVNRVAFDPDYANGRPGAVPVEFTAQ